MCIHALSSTGMPSPSVHLLNSDCAQILQSYIICSVELSLITSGKITPKALMYVIVVTLHNFVIQLATPIS